MIRKVQVENFKSIPDLTLELGRITVLIGANGCGKSNILEVIAMASAAVQNKLDNEFLVARGIRVSEPQFMCAAFGTPAKANRTSIPPNPVDLHFAISENKKLKLIHPPTPRNTIKLSIKGEGTVSFDCDLWIDQTATFPRWRQSPKLSGEELVTQLLLPNVKKQPGPNFHHIDAVVASEALNRLLSERSGTLPDFLIYAPENSALRTFQTEGQILPLGIRGEGLFAHLKALNSPKYLERLEKIKASLALIDWFETFDIPKDLSPGERSIRIRDRFLPDDALFDQRSANEGFLFLLFYLTLFISPDTPAFFAIDNIDSSLNPKLCIALLRQLVILSAEYGKQVIVTTHNPAVLDGLDLHDSEQRLLVVDRNKLGHTRVHRVEPPTPIPGQAPVSLAEAFLRGYIGGLPKNF